MKLSAVVVAVSVPVLAAASLAPEPLVMTGPAEHGLHPVPVNFVDRLLQGASERRSRSSSHRKAKAPVAEQPQSPEPDLPDAVPVPVPRPAPKDAPAASPAPPAEKQPEVKRDAAPPASDDTRSNAPEKTEPSNAPKAGPAPDGADDGASAGQDDAGGQPEPVHEDPASLKACFSELQGMGATFEKKQPMDEGNGCGVEAPVKVDEVLPGVSLGGAIMRCQTAVGLAKWLKLSVQPAVDAAMPGRKIVGLVPGTTFACRLRNNASTGMISEHARGNAFDVAGFRLDDGKTLEMKPRQDDHTLEGAFQNAATAGACLYFTTVLAPGTDAAHETHLHVDIRDRKNGYRICDAM